MKQHGIFFGLFGGAYLAFSHIYQPQSIKEKREKNAASRHSEFRSIGKSGSDRQEARSAPSAEDQSLLTSAAKVKRSRREAHRPVRVGLDWPRLFKELALF